MTNIEFVFESQNINIQGNQSESFKQIINKFCMKVSINSNEIDFFINGQLKKKKKTVDKYIMKFKENKMKVLAIRKNKEDNRDIIEKYLKI